VFTYSERDNTEAVYLGNVVPKEIRLRRNKMLQILSEKKRRAFYEQHLGETRKVLFELNESSGYTEGFTDNYIKVKARIKNVGRKVFEVRLNELSGESVAGEVFNSNSKPAHLLNITSQAIFQEIS
jgi:tRNA A37 methylthiotransferase MiaB